MAKIEVVSPYLDSLEIEEAIRRVLEQNQISHDAVAIRQEPSPYRSLDTPMTVAIIGVIGPVLASIITGLFSTLKTKAEAKVICEKDAATDVFLTEADLQSGTLRDLLEGQDVEKIYIERHAIRIVFKRER